MTTYCYFLFSLVIRAARSPMTEPCRYPTRHLIGLTAVYFIVGVITVPFYGHDTVALNNDRTIEKQI